MFPLNGAKFSVFRDEFGMDWVAMMPRFWSVKGQDEYRTYVTRFFCRALALHDCETNCGPASADTKCMASKHPQALSLPTHSMVL